jgi:hypothetical protein
MPPTGTFTTYPSLLEPLPPLVRKQRRLAAVLAAVAHHEKDEKATRQEIDRLLLAAGLKKSDVVTCLGYDVKHNERDGQASINADKVTEQLVAAGVDRDLVVKVLVDSTETGEPAKFATVTPSKGAKVRV